MPSSKIEREIEEILSRLEALPSPLRRRIPFRGQLQGRIRPLTHGVSQRLPRLTSGHLMLTAMGLILVSWLVLRTSGDVGRYLLFAGLALFVLAFLLSVQSRSAARGRVYWRGQAVELKRPGWRDRLRGWRRRPH